MTKRRAFIFALVFTALAALVYLQARTWMHLQWRGPEGFIAVTKRADLKRLLSAIALIYSVYYLRAVRWKVFLRPVCKASAASLTPPQFIGFTGLALLGRPGEFIRPYLIARRENLSVPSQLAVWTVERLFDTASVTLLFALLIFSGALNTVPLFSDSPDALGKWRVAGWALVALVLIGVSVAFLIRRNGERLAGWIEGHVNRWAPHLGHLAAQRVRAFGEGLNTIHDASSFVQLLGISLCIWLVVGLAYFQVIRAYPADAPALHNIAFAHVVLLMVSSMAGSVLQLPGIGGGSQLATIAVLANMFFVPPVLATSCGIMLWLITFMAVIPAGLVLARREHVSLRQLEAESHRNPSAKH
ncbi:MAG: flippase-like domain-containing protein [Candidatus Koribacter versatilis]|uniref:Flippase-like domain-containing protein n=1 Tax=Candidatus Korobacter versatilis TaxID=658062 RepID=A0A932EN77_9BACT|nr:flippase-like domain-containing protein [Candidatus Koribacter versatilis]